MRIRFIGLALLVSLCVAPSLRAEKVDMPPAGLRKVATHVITGTVAKIYERKSREGTWNYTRYVAEIHIKTVEKGEGLSVDGLVYVRYWRRSWAGPGMVPPSTGGHRGLPNEGDAIRIYLASKAYDGFFSDNDDGGFNVIGANGFEALPVDRDGNK